MHAQESSLPNILLINVDDMGYGDPQCINPNSKLSTPHIDSLATQGRIFSQAYTCAAICGPSRYGLLTGRHAWRSGLTSGNGATLGQSTIDSQRMTLGSLLLKHGYDTAMVGKWGVRFDFRSATTSAFNPTLPSSVPSLSQIDFSKPIYGPKRHGFEYARNAVWIGTGHQWVENGVSDSPPGINGIMSTGDDDEYRLRLGIELEAAVNYLNSKGNQISGNGSVDPKYGQEKGKPFFLYFATGAPHTPITPTAAFQGSSGVDLYGDFIQNLDDTIGQLLQALDDNNLSDNTLVIFTSDNGAEVATSKANAYSRAVNQGHFSMGPLRGGKRSLHEAGTRVPFIVKWPNKVMANSVSSQVISQTDLLATFADILDVDLPDNAGEDSVSSLDAFLTTNPMATTPRDLLIHAGATTNLAIRQDSWVLIKQANYASPSETSAFRDLIGVPNTDNDFSGSLYNLNTDLRQTTNLYHSEAATRNKMLESLENYKKRGRTAPSRLYLANDSFEDEIYRYSGHDSETEVGGVSPGWTGYSDSVNINGFFTGGLGSKRDELSLIDETRSNVPDTPSGKQWQNLKIGTHTIAEVGRNLGSVNTLQKVVSANNVIDMTFLLSARRANSRDDIYDVKVSLIAGSRDSWDSAKIIKSIVVDADTNGELVTNVGDTVDAADSVYLKGVYVNFDLSDVKFTDLENNDVWLVFSTLDADSNGSSNTSNQTLIDGITLAGVPKNERLGVTHLSNNHYILDFKPRPNRSYIIQKSVDLTPDSWEAMVTLPAHTTTLGDIYHYKMNMEGEDRGFFRLH
ncbi:arylsulfatase [Verrucomicrobiaceae bacterium N1E253]|uniref:Arylsulfatase n=1 Tax=Oceaniferula marina TaxID=2748318 RepID=A0A851GGT4_9BACT|nr:arylsulfatase [Oceaniferula marina]NWK55051.1 arylsulfatase [Oceaniferula marina]